MHPKRTSYKIKKFRLKKFIILIDCRKYGTLPFAHSARAGFVAVTHLKSFAEKIFFYQRYNNWWVKYSTSKQFDNS